MAKSTYPMSVRDLAARIVDVAIGAPLGTTPGGKNIPWHSPPVGYAYVRIRAEIGGNDGNRIMVDKSLHDAVIDHCRTRAERNPDAFRVRYAHTAESGCTGRNPTTDPMPWYGDAPDAATA